MKHRSIAVVAALLGLVSADALAARHLMKVVEVFPGTAAMPNAQYVVLQMYAASQTFVGGHEVAVFDAADTLLGADEFTGNLTNGANQSRILVATTDAVTLFGVSADLTLTTALPSGGGAVCFGNTPSSWFDCVSWGAFVDGPDGASETGAAFAPGSGLTHGRAVACDIAAHGSALLEGTDCEDSLADHECGDANPRNNAGSAGFLAADPPCPACGDGTTDDGEQCDGADDLACPLECQADCTCLLDQPILGKLLVLRDPQPADPTRRAFTIKAREIASPNFLTGNPISDGASLTVDVAGATPSSQTFTLPAGAPFWSSLGGLGFRYRDPAGANGPVKLLLVKRSNAGVFTISVTGKATGGMVDLVPGNPAAEATATLTLGSLSDKYCTAFGGPAGGTLNPNTAVQLRILNPTSAPASCP